MKKVYKIKCLAIGIILTILSCATSMTPVEVHNTLPTLTESRYLTVAQAEEGVRANRCRYLVRGRNYTAPIGFTVRDDLRNAAKGIDEWVKINGGNAYVLTNFNWITVGYDTQYGTTATQLIVEFDILIYEE